jgi:type III pantothenate kinase
MLLTIDIGNSHTVVGLFDADRLSGQWRFQSDRDRTDDELAVQLHGLLSLTGLDCHAITGVILVSVVPVLEKTWLSCCRKYLAAFLERPAQVVSAPWMQGHMTILTDHPGEVGADRLVNGIVAWQRYQCNLVIIDFGTAITFDCVSCGCEFLGGAILPGINISLEALASRTAKLPRIDLSAGPDKVIGANTIQAMKSGILHGYAALVDGLTKKLLAEMGRPPEKPKVIATGGMAQLIAPYCQAIEVVDPNLTLKGLHYLYHTEAIHE